MVEKKFEIKGKAAEFINMVFQSFLVTYLILLLIEQIQTGTVSFYINLNWLLVIVIILGILDVFSIHEERKPDKIKKRDYAFIIILGILGFLIIKFKTDALGWLSWLISIVAGVLIILLSILVLEDEEDEKPKEHVVHHKHKQELFALNLVLVALSLGFISIVLTFFTTLSVAEAARIVFGSVYVLFLPGFIISYIFFPKSKPFDSDEEEKGAIDWIERIALSFALSIAVVPLVVFYLNLGGLSITLLHTSLTILGIILLSLFILLVNHSTEKHKREKERVFEMLKYKNRG